MGNNELHAYIAGFFDGEGSILIARANRSDFSDEHWLIVCASQRTDYASVLYEIQAEFGGKVRRLKRRTQYGPSEISEWTRVE